MIYFHNLKVQMSLEEGVFTVGVAITILLKVKKSEDSEEEM